MGYKGMLRSFGAAIRQAERESIKRQRDLERRKLAHQKMQDLEQAAYDVEVYENYIDRITSLHKDCISNCDWFEISKKSVPSAPEKKSAREFLARKKYEEYIPNFIDKLFKLEEKKRKKLEEKLSKAIHEDANEYELLRKKYQTELSEHTELTDMAQKVL